MDCPTGAIARLWILLVVLVGTAAHAGTDASYEDVMSWRNVGPNLGGRSIAVAGSTARPNEYYFGATGGGLWKTTSGGTTWFPVTDGQIDSASVGAIGLCQKNPDIVYIGTGEVQLRGTASQGDGVYRSVDGGKTWKYLGLASSSGQQTISRLRVHPEDCSTVYAAILGDPWGPNAERGVYKSVDGGDTWQQVLFRDRKTGAADLWIDENNPSVVYASLWQVRRRPWEANSGGPGSGLFKSEDGGDSWVEITDRLGLAPGRVGKIGVSVSRADSDRVYVIVEHENGGLFRSDDGGVNWEHVNDNRALIDRAEYYIRTYADPVDADRVYVLVGSGFYRSDNGGETFKAIRTLHVDNHDVWIDPTDNRRMIESNDGGASVSVDGGRNWTSLFYPTAQIYHVTATKHFPFHLCGAQQDWQSKCVPSDGDGSYWYLAGAGEQGYIAIDPKDPNVQYGGAQRSWFRRYNSHSGQRKAIDVWPVSQQGLPPNAVRERFQWTFPIVVPPTEPDALYVASQHVWRSDSGGESWTRVSPDLTYADPAQLEGEKSVIPNQNSQDYYATVFSLAASHFEKGTLWAGSDDGLVHLTRDGGKNWVNVTPAGLRKDSRVSMIEASPHDPGKAFLAVERYKMQDIGTYVYRTKDYGASWELIVDGIKPGHYSRSIREDTKREGLLFLGTEHAPYVSFDDGDRWVSLRLNLPDLQISDMVVSGDSLAAATYGRGIWVLDDLSVLRHWPDAAGNDVVTVFPPRDSFRSLSRPTQNYARARLPWLNAVTLYYQLEDDVDRVDISIFDSNDRLVRSFSSASVAKEWQIDNVGRPINGPGWSSRPDTIETKRGLHSFRWDMRYPPVEEFAGMRLRGGSTNGPYVPPGRYKARVVVGSVSETQQFEILPDPRVAGVSEDDYQAQTDLAMKVHRRLADAIQAVVSIRQDRTKLIEQIDAANDIDAPRLRARLAELNDILLKIYDERNRSPSGALQFGVKLVNQLAILHRRTIWSADGRPTAQAFEAYEFLSDELEQRLREYANWKDAPVADQVDEDLAYGLIARTPVFDKEKSNKILTRAQAAADLEQLAGHIATQHSYVTSTDFDYKAAIQHLRAGLPDEVPVAVLAMQIQKLVQYLGDNHARLYGWQDYLPQRFLPFALGFKGDRVFAYHRDRSGLFDERYPFVRSIDGVSIDQWLRRAGDITSGPGGSVSQRWQRSLDLLEFVDFMRSELNLPSSPEVALILESQDGRSVTERTVPVEDQRISAGKPFGVPEDSRLLAGNIGYLRIYSQQDDELLASIPGWMKDFKETEALIIDARQCGGGLRSNLQALFPYFMSPDDQPYIANVAKLRIPGDAEDFDPRGKLNVGGKGLKYRFDDDVSKAESASLERFLETFEPHWQPPEDQFTDWYFMAMSHGDTPYYYDRPVFLIMDWGVGSAGDIFVSTFKSWRNVTLVGMPSNGRSGHSRSFLLDNSGLPVRLSTMASFQKTGEKYDNVGIQPDIFLEPEISDWMASTDTILDSVIAMAKSAIERR